MNIMNRVYWEMEDDEILQRVLEHYSLGHKVHLDDDYRDLVIQGLVRKTLENKVTAIISLQKFYLGINEDTWVKLFKKAKYIAWWSLVLYCAFNFITVN